MSIPDKAVEAAAQAIWNVPPIHEGRASWEYWNENNPAGPEKLRKQARAALEAAEPYLTGPQIHIESGLRQAIELLLGAYIDVHGGKVGAPGSRERVYYSVSVDLQNALNRHPEVKS